MSVFIVTSFKKKGIMQLVLDLKPTYLATESSKKMGIKTGFKLGPIKYFNNMPAKLSFNEMGL